MTPTCSTVDGVSAWTIPYSHGRWLHREDGPAYVDISPDGETAWYFNGAVHRIDGPAVVWNNGTVEWWLDDMPYSFNEYVKLAKWTDKQIVEWKLMREL